MIKSHWFKGLHAKASEQNPSTLMLKKTTPILEVRATENFY